MYFTFARSACHHFFVSRLRPLRAGNAVPACHISPALSRRSACRSWGRCQTTWRRTHHSKMTVSMNLSRRKGASRRHAMRVLQTQIQPATQEFVLLVSQSSGGRNEHQRCWDMEKRSIPNAEPHCSTTVHAPSPPAVRSRCPATNKAAMARLAATRLISECPCCCCFTFCPQTAWILFGHVWERPHHAAPRIA